MDEQLAETQQQLVLVCQALGGARRDISGSDLHHRDQDMEGQPSASAELRDATVQHEQSLTYKPTASPAMVPASSRRAQAAVSRHMKSTPAAGSLSLVTPRGEAPLPVAFVMPNEDPVIQGVPEEGMTTPPVGNDDDIKGHDDRDGGVAVSSTTNAGASAVLRVASDAKPEAGKTATEASEATAERAAVQGASETESDALSPLASSTIRSSLSGPADGESGVESCKTCECVEDIVVKGAVGATVEEMFERCVEVPPPLPTAALDKPSAYVSDTDRLAKELPETSAKMEKETAVEGGSETTAEATLGRLDNTSPRLPTAAIVTTIKPVHNPGATGTEARKPSESAAEHLVAPATVTSTPVFPASVMPTSENPATPEGASVPPPEQLMLEPIVLEGKAEKDQRATDTGASNSDSSSDSRCSSSDGNSSSTTQHATSSSAAVWPSSIARRRRSSEALSGLPRSSSMQTMRQEKQHQLHHRQKKTSSSHQQAESLVQAAKAGARVREAGTAEGNAIEQRRSRPHSPSSSPEPRGGSTENQNLPPGEEGREQQHDRSGAAVGLGLMVTEAAAAGDEGRTPRSCFPSSSPESREVSTKDMATAWQKSEGEHEHRQLLDRPKAVAMAEKVAGMAVSAAGHDDGYAERIQYQIDNVTDGGSKGDSRRNAENGIGSSKTIAPVVSTNSSRQERGRSSGLWASLRGTVGSKTMSKKKNNRGEKRRSRSMSPQARG